MELLGITPVLPSSDIARDANWYTNMVGFQLVNKDSMYAVLKRGKLYIHLQWHADTKEDPLFGGSVVKIFVENIQSLFEEFLARGTITEDKFRLKTDWNTNEFGFYDLNNNAIFFVETM